MTTREHIAQLLRETEPETRAAVAEIFRIEKQYAYHVRAVRVKEQVLAAIREAVR